MNENNKFEVVLKKAISLKTTNVNREDFLRKELMKVVGNSEIVERAILTNPAQAGIDVTTINKVADECINYQTTLVTGLSTAAGIPGGPAVLATIPADTIQYFAHILIITQKLAYLYGWDELIDSNNQMDDATNNLLTLFIGVMFGVSEASKQLIKLSSLIASNTSKKLMQKTLTKTTVYNVTKKVAKIIGVKLTKQTFSKGVGKIIPVVGGVLSGVLTYASYKPMAKKLKNHLSQLDRCNVYYYRNPNTKNSSEVIDI